MNSTQKWLYSLPSSCRCIDVTWWFHGCMCIWLHCQFEQVIMHVEFGQWQRGIHHQCRHLKRAFDMVFTLMFIFSDFGPTHNWRLDLGNNVYLVCIYQKNPCIFYIFFNNQYKHSTIILHALCSRSYPFLSIVYKRYF